MKNSTSKQKGYLNLNGLITAIVVFGVVIGIIISIVVPWLWSLVKPFIHSITA